MVVLNWNTAKAKELKVPVDSIAASVFSLENTGNWYYEW
jgi:hypothetical protein